MDIIVDILFAIVEIFIDIWINKIDKKYSKKKGL